MIDMLEPVMARIIKKFLASLVTLSLTPLPVFADITPDEAKIIRDEIEAETRCYVSPGPEKAGPRAICVWRPANAGADLLPTLYMADGMIGIYVAAIPLKRAIESGELAPLMVIGLDPQADPEERAEEYVRHFHGPKSYEAHNRWFVDYVIPWAERTRKAAPDPAKRYIGGFSNGADWATTTAAEHADLFAGVLVHSPMMTKTKTVGYWQETGANTLRWVVSGGTEEISGTIKKKAELPKKLASSMAASGAPVRVCIGKWAHEPRAWRLISGGSIAWMMQLGDPAVATNSIEAKSCASPS